MSASHVASTLMLVITVAVVVLAMLFGITLLYNMTNWRCGDDCLHLVGKLLAHFNHVPIGVSARFGDYRLSLVGKHLAHFNHVLIGVGARCESCMCQFGRQAVGSF